MSVLVIGGGERKRIQEIVAYAQANRMDAAYIQKLMRSGVAVGLDPRRCCILPIGYRVVFSIEEHPSGWLRHISISVDRPDKCPSLEAVAMICEEFGFIRPLGQCGPVYLEGKAVNVLQSLNEQP